jgi:hypothetical protein
VPQIDVIDSTWIAAPPRAVAPVVADERNWAGWWPVLDLAVDERRGDRGVRWIVRGVRGARDAGLAGSAEVWLQPMFGGVVAHFFLRLDPAAGKRLPARHAARIERALRRRTKAAFWALADAADPDRARRAAQPLSAPPQPVPAGPVPVDAPVDPTPDAATSPRARRRPAGSL